LANVRILYIGMKYDGGDPRRGFCYEYLNFLDTLQRMKGFQTQFFAFDEEMRRDGKAGMNRALLRAVDDLRPDFCFFVLRMDEIMPETIAAISRKPGITTMNWFGDDHWRFRPFSRHWAPLFHVAVTTYSRAVEWYRSAGYVNVIRSQWAFNHHFLAWDLPVLKYPVSFVGQPHSRRHEQIAALGKSHILVECRGRGWPKGAISQSELLATYRGSRINLNFSDCWCSAGLKPKLNIFLRRTADGALRLNPPSIIIDLARVNFARAERQIKARPFEVVGMGGLLITAEADDFDRYLKPDVEVVIFHSVEDLASKIRYYLTHDDEREAIRQAGQRRVLREHTYERRFRELFALIG
jgi:spore maturation protein CgeB